MRRFLSLLLVVLLLFSLLAVPASAMSAGAVVTAVDGLAASFPVRRVGVAERLRALSGSSQAPAHPTEVPAEIARWVTYRVVVDITVT